MEELRPGLLGLRRRFLANNFELIRTIYTDRPDTDRTVWEDVFPELKPSDAEDPLPGLPAPRPHFTCSADDVAYVNSKKAFSSVMEKINLELEQMKQENKQMYVGLDAEWNIGKQLKGANKVLTIQLSLPSGFSAVFHLPFLIDKYAEFQGTLYFFKFVSSHN